MISEAKAIHASVSTRELCRLLRVSRASLYRARDQQNTNLEPISEPSPQPKLTGENTFLRDEIETIVLKHPWYGYRRVQKQLARQGIHVNRKRVLRIMQLEALTCKVKK